MSVLCVFSLHLSYHKLYTYIHVDLQPSLRYGRETLWENSRSVQQLKRAHATE